LSGQAAAITGEIMHLDTGFHVLANFGCKEVPHKEC